MRRIKLIISYDGTNFHGFQIQKELRTVEKVLNDTLSRLLKEDIKVCGSGRTDKGVHAIGQVIHFDTLSTIPLNKIAPSLNDLLPQDIVVKDALLVDNNFHARFSVLKKTYKYIITTKDDLFYRNYKAFYDKIDISKMKDAIKYLIGTHNFIAFCSSGVHKDKDFVKTIYSIDIEEKDEDIIFTFTANGFLKYQIRRMMGALIEIGKDKKDVEFIKRTLESQDRKLSHKVALASGLYLWEVIYE